MTHDALDRRIAVWITARVSTMGCAYLFAAIALIGLPSAIRETIRGETALPIVMWWSQLFLQLVLLSVIMVGNSVREQRLEARAARDHAALMEMHRDHRMLVLALHTKHDDLRRAVQAKKPGHDTEPR